MRFGSAEKSHTPSLLNAFGSIKEPTWDERLVDEYKSGKESDPTPFGLRPKMPKVTFFKKSLCNARTKLTLNHF